MNEIVVRAIKQINTHTSAQAGSKPQISRMLPTRKRDELTFPDFHKIQIHKTS
jgi:hypothetical protein